MSNDLGIDRSGNGNNWTVNNLAYSDVMVDSPTNNFATLNPLDKTGFSSIQEGNLQATGQVAGSGIVGTQSLRCRKMVLGELSYSWGAEILWSC